MPRRLLLVMAILVVALAAAAGLAGRTARTDGGGTGRDDAVESRGPDAPATGEREGDAPTTSTSPATATTTTAARSGTSDDRAGAGDREAAGPGDPGPPPSAPGETVLTADGLGIVDFGAPGPDVVAALTAALGPPDQDTGPNDRTQVLGACPAGRQRALHWGALTVGLLDGTSTYSSRATEHFMMYSYGDTASPAAAPTPRLATDLGVSLTATVDEVRQAYGDDAEVVPGDEIVEPRVRVELDARQPLVLRTPGDEVTSIVAGEPCA